MDMYGQYLTLHEGFSFSDFLLQIHPELPVEELSKNLSQLGALTESVLAAEYKNYKQVSFFDLSKEAITIDRDRQLPEKNAYAFNAIVIGSSPDGVIVGFSNPFDQEVVRSAESIVNAYLKPVMVKAKDLKRLLRLTYRKIEEIQRVAISAQKKYEIVDTLELIDVEEDGQISELANLILRDAFEIDASDIHIEMNHHAVDVRLRIDGMLQKYSLPNVSVGDHLVRYFKLLADVDITQDQKPSEGKKVDLIVGQEDINLRISFMPTYNGQSVVIRILGKAASYVLSDKIKNSEYLSEIQNYLARSYGMFLVSGPTGSGKTTTLYSALQEVNKFDRNIITLEDPVEAKIPGANQVQVNEVINYSFADGIRAALRQDPDIIMIGEIRDEITANMAVRAAITGHLVLSTVHARGVSEIPLRLLNLKVDPYLLASALRLTVSQRLVRKICPNCKEVCVLTETEKKFVERYLKNTVNNLTFYHGKGCYYCQETGFSQREAIFEVLHMTAEMITCLAQNAIPEYMELVKQAMLGRTILDHAFILASQGVIAMSEVMRMESD
jgi:MSHA biogenesis protein MshE